MGVLVKKKYGESSQEVIFSRRPGACRGGNQLIIDVSIVSPMASIASRVTYKSSARFAVHQAPWVKHTKYDPMLQQHNIGYTEEQLNRDDSEEFEEDSDSDEQPNHYNHIRNMHHWPIHRNQLTWNQHEPFAVITVAQKDNKWGWTMITGKPNYQNIKGYTKGFCIKVDSEVLTPQFTLQNIQL